MNAADVHRLSAEQLMPGLATQRVGRRILVLPEIDSTNSHCLQSLAAREGIAADGTVVFAERQTAGRGRLGHSWHSPTGASLMFTTLLHEPVNVSRAAFWTMAAALAVVRGIEDATDVAPSIRWPNDVYAGTRKLAGILVEARVVAAPTDGPVQRPQQAWLAVGIGLNCFQQRAHFPPELRDRATSLEIESRRPIDRSFVARALLRALDGYFANPSRVDDDALAVEWCRHSGDIGRRTTLVCGAEEAGGVILDVHPKQGLLLQLDTGARRHFDPATTSRLE